RYAARTLRRSPAFTATSVAVLALAAGANTAMFSVLNAVLFRPLPFPAAEQLTMLWSETPDRSAREGRSAYGNFEAWRQQNRSFADLAAFDPASATLTGAEGAERIPVVRTSANFPALLGLQLVRGRVFTPDEAARREPVALISHQFWQTRFGGS